MFCFSDSDGSADENSLSNKNVFGVAGGASSNKSTPSKKAYVEPTPEELQKSKEARIASQNSDPFYLKGTVKSSPSRTAPSSNNVSDIPIQKIDLEVPLHTIPGLASTDQYLEMNNGKKKEKKRKKKKDKRKDSVQDEEEEEEDQVPSMLVSLNAEMPEGVELSDGK